MQEGFTAKKVTFDGTPGYMVLQYSNGKVVVEQFIPEESFEFFCSKISFAPILIDD